MSKSAEFPHSTCSRLLPKESKNSAEKKNSPTVLPNFQIRLRKKNREFATPTPTANFYEYENKSYKILPQGDKWNYKFPTYMLPNCKFGKTWVCHRENGKN